MTFDIVGRAGTGAMISLAAVGMQDTFLTDNSSSSFFQFKPQQHTQFTKYNTAYMYTSLQNANWPFGQKVTFHLNPRTMGDLLCNMYLKIQLPHGDYTSNNLGFALLNSIEFRVDSQVIETVQCDWNIIYKELFCLLEEQAAIDQLFQGPNLLVPLQFFFDRKHSSKDTGNPLLHQSFFKPYFLTCACYAAKEIAITITFNDIAFFSFGNSNLSLDNVTLITEEVILTTEERLWIQNNRQRQIITYMSNNPRGFAPRGSFSHSLVNSGSVKCLYWFFRNTKYESGTWIQNRFNFCAMDDPVTKDDETQNQCITNLDLYLNNEQVLASLRSDPNYFKFAQPVNHALTVPYKNIYTYSFCLNPKNPSPSGALDFSQMDSSGTKITGRNITSHEISINAFFSGYNILTYEKGVVSLGFV